MIKRKDGRWQEQVKLPGMSKPKYFYGKTKAEVTKKIAAWQKEQERGRLFSDCADDWANWHEKQVSESSLGTYKKPIEDVKTFFQGKYIREIRADEIDAFLRSLAAKGFARSTVGIRRDCVNMIFDYSIINLWCEYNPCKPVKLPKGLQAKRRTPPDEEVLTTVANAPKKDGALFAAILMYTGLRRGELLGLRWGDIDLEARTIKVRRNVYFLGGSPHVKTPKTKAGERTVGIVDKLAEILKQPGEGYLFGGDKPLTNGEFTRMWMRFCREHGWVDANGGQTVTPHQFRHFFATVLFEAGVSEMDTMEIMGHSSISITHDIYTHIRENRRRLSMDKLNRYLNSGGAEESCQDCVDSGNVVDISGVL